ncbi:MAG: hypothetical protein COB04_07525 [Gammaproteobacteria bacterium]|nr:MAG: hypothetical protein COB04_07525 [Gammaproteobacteria bacterium]
MKQEIQSAVEQQLMVTGAYSPLEWLIDSGHVLYPDYVAWRNGDESGSLQSLSHLSESELLDFLNAAAQFAGKLGLESEVVVLKGWQRDNAQQALFVSRNDQLATLLQQRWCRPEKDVQQFDLFMDNPTLVLENDFLELFFLRRWDDAQKKLDKIYQCDPGHAKLGSYENLVAYGQHCEQPIVLVGDSCRDDLALIEEELLGLESEVEPLCARVLSRSGRDYLAPAWARIGAALEGQEFVPEHPKLHASYAWQQYHDWGKTQRSIESEPDYLRQPVLLWRLALAHCYQQRRGPGLALLCLVLSLDQAFASQQFEQCPDVRFLSIWQAFQDLEGELPLSDFPGWWLLHDRGVVAQLKDFSVSGIGLVYAAVSGLLLASAEQDMTTELVFRKRLLECSPGLLKVYLQDK